MESRLWKPLSVSEMKANLNGSGLLEVANPFLLKMAVGRLTNDKWGD